MAIEKRLEWTCSHSIWWGYIVSLSFVGLIFTAIAVNAPAAVVALFGTFTTIACIQPLLIPRKIIINEDIIAIIWILRKISIKKHNIARVKIIKLKYLIGRIQCVFIIQNKQVSIRNILSLLPMLVPYELKPYYGSDDSTVYDIAEEIRTWINVR